MKQKIAIAILLLYSSFLGSCIGDRMDSGKTKSFVLAYQQMNNEDFQITQLDSVSIVMYSTAVTMIGNWKSKGIDKKKYISLSEKYGDVSYNRNIYVYHENYINPIIDIYIKNIQVVSNNDYDDHHPAGSNLSDIINYIGASPYRFIQNNYVKRTSNPITERGLLYVDKIMCGAVLCSIRDEELLQGYYVTEKCLSDLDIDDLKMIGVRSSIVNKNYRCYSFGILEFTQIPTLEKIHTLKVTMNLVDGTKAEDTVVMKF